ncbi:hypothetical protein BDZ89DRAFT_1065957 [Hymenopellis radicata]|nr:hypothetical protein BDZ89DRAFT_1069740 [Hymenopellis radicata]KAF9028667.1 hypothetical protein BDZ89DRAFT_1065957 [Hymenopellis radicata]
MKHGRARPETPRPPQSGNRRDHHLSVKSFRVLASVLLTLLFYLNLETAIFR